MSSDDKFYYKKILEQIIKAKVKDEENPGALTDYLNTEQKNTPIYKMKHIV